MKHEWGADPSLHSEREFGYEQPMPIGNNFQHADYSRADPGERASYREVEAAAPPDSPAWQDEMARLGAQLAAAGVRAVLFVHGVAPGTDPFGAQRLDEVGGLRRGYSRGIAGLDALLALMRQETNGLPQLPGSLNPPFKDDDQTRKLLDEQIGDACSFTTAYVDRFKEAVNRNVSRQIACLRLLWSSEHHHLGRSQAAWRLLLRLRGVCEELKLGPDDRLLVQAHGQAGLVLALASNLLAQEASSGRKRFFQILTGFSERSGAGPETIAQLTGLAEQLADGRLLSGATLDVVTFGTPIRYGWDTSGVGRLLHVVNHRVMRTDGKRWLAKTELPQITMEMPIAWGGDYVQQLAVAASDAATPKEPGAQAANKDLWELLEPYDGFERWLECARRSVRCANDGLCLLADYKDAGSPNVREHLYGHAAYTRLANLLFNTTQIVRTLYAS
ncbi:MAG: hypothetical protein AB1411_08790 [Nitrospirota bacterium]